MQRKAKKNVCCFAFDLIGTVFIDFNESFFLQEPQKLGKIDIVYITNDAQANIYTEMQHNIQTQAKIALKGVEGMSQINGPEITMTPIDSYTLKAEIDSTGFSKYAGSGQITVLSLHLDNTLLPLEDILINPTQHNKVLPIIDFTNPDRSKQLHILVHTLLAFANQHVHFPVHNNTEDTNNFATLFKSKKYLSTFKSVSIDENMIHRVLSICQAQLSPHINLLGGIAVQELLKMIKALKPIQPIVIFLTRWGILKILR
jgi:archaellum biogenesis ATPase FlaH